MGRAARVPQGAGRKESDALTPYHISVLTRRPAFGAMLRKLRITAGLSQQSLAERARISVQAVSALERGVRHAPRKDTLELLADALRLDANERAAFESAADASTKPRVRNGREAEITWPSLPRIPTSFVGRVRERDEVAALLKAGSCTTLWGSGGIGKTRLVLETIAAIAHRFTDGIYFAELAPVFDDEDVIRVTAAVAGVHEEAGSDLAESLHRALAGKNALLVLDNSEHVLSGCASLVDRLLRDATSLAIVATSREPLRVHGEHVYPVGSLPLPNIADPDLASSPAIRLFLDRAADVGAPLDVTPDSLRAIADIATRLDAIPLAIELAAARAPMMSVRQISSGLDDRFRLLTLGARTASARQKTLYEALNWSYALVSEIERIVLRRLAVWPGSWTLDDAVALAGAGLTRWDVIEAVGGLVDASLVVASFAHHDDERRYSLLQTTEAFALERALEAGELEDGRRLQAQRIATVVRDGVHAWRGSGETRALLSFDVAPVRAALRWTLTNGADPHLGGTLAGQATVFWGLRDMHVEAMRWLDEALAILPADDDEARAEVQVGRVRIATLMLREREAFDAAVDAMRHADRSGDVILRGTARLLFAGPAAKLGYVEEARRALNEAMALHDRIGDDRGRVAVAWQLPHLAMVAGDYAEAVRLLEPLVATAREQRALMFVAQGSITLGDAEFARGNTAVAIARASEALIAARDSSGTLFEANALFNLAAYHLDIGEVVEAATFARDSLELTRANGYDVLTSVAIGHLAEVIGNRGHVREAAILTGYVDHKLQVSGTVRSTTEQRGRDRLEALFAHTLEPPALEAALREGTSLDEDGATRIALHLVSE